MTDVPAFKGSDVLLTVRGIFKPKTFMMHFVVEVSLKVPLKSVEFTYLITSNSKLTDHSDWRDVISILSLVIVVVVTCNCSSGQDTITLCAFNMAK